MTVQQLIAALQSRPQDAEVRVWGAGYGDEESDEIHLDVQGDGSVLISHFLGDPVHAQV